MSTRMPYIEALSRSKKDENTHEAFLKSAYGGKIEVRCESITQFDFCVLDFHLDDYGIGDVIYIDPLLLDRETGVISVGDIAKFENGFHQWLNPPYWHAHKEGRNITIYTALEKVRA